MTISLDIQDGNFVLRCPPRERDFAKLVPGLKFAGTLDAYVGPANWTVAQILNGVFTPRGLEVTEAVTAWMQVEYTRITELIAFKRSDNDFGIEIKAASGDRLFPWQANDSYYAALAKSVIDTSHLGTGKTPKYLSAVRMAEALGADVFPLVIVGRNNLLYQLEEEVHNWLPGKSTQVVPKGLTPVARSKALLSGADVILVPWHLLATHSKLARYGSTTLPAKKKEPKELNEIAKSVIFDEAHKALDPSTDVTKAMWGLADGLEYKYFLTNTPMENAPDELWCLLRAAYPEHFPSSVRFKDRYCHMVPQFFGPDKCMGLNPANEVEFQQIYEPMHVERGPEYLSGIPRPEWFEMRVDLDGKQRQYYNSMEKNGIIKVKDLVLAATDPLVKRTRLLQLANATPVLGITKNSKGEDAVGIVEYGMPSCKVDALFESLDRWKGEPLLVFMDDRKLLNLCAKELEKAGVSFVEFKGGMKDAVREAGRHEFQSGSVQVALAMFQVAAEGLTLTNAYRTLYLQRDDSSINSEQSEGRTRRIGQTADRVEYWDVIANETEEYKVHENYLGKQRRRNKALGRDIETRQLSA